MIPRIFGINMWIALYFWRACKGMHIYWHINITLIFTFVIFICRCGCVKEHFSAYKFLSQCTLYQLSAINISVIRNKALDLQRKYRMEISYFNLCYFDIIFVTLRYLLMSFKMLFSCLNIIFSLWDICIMYINLAVYLRLRLNILFINFKSFYDCLTFRENIILAIILKRNFRLLFCLFVHWNILWILKS